MELGPFPTSLGLAILQVYTDELNARRPPDTKTILHKLAQEKDSHQRKEL